jgi:hypothetical protein
MSGVSAVNDSDFTLGNSPEAIIVSYDDEPKESALGPTKRSKQWDRAVADDIFMAYKRQDEEIMNLKMQARAEFAKGQFDSANELVRRANHLERGELATEAIPVPLTKSEDSTHGEGPLSIAAREVKMSDARQALFQTLRHKLQSADFPTTDLNIKQNPAIFKAGFKAGLKEALRLIQETDPDR